MGQTGRHTMVKAEFPARLDGGIKEGQLRWRVQQGKANFLGEFSCVYVKNVQQQCQHKKYSRLTMIEYLIAIGSREAEIYGKS